MQRRVSSHKLRECVIYKITDGMIVGWNGSGRRGSTRSKFRSLVIGVMIVVNSGSALILAFLDLIPQRGYLGFALSLQ